MEPLSFLEFLPDFTAPATVAAYDEQPLWSAMFGLLMLEHVPLGPTVKALDVGCGTGFPLIELAERLGPASEVHGIDPWQQALVRAAEKIAARGLRNVTIHEGTAADMPFPDAMFDLIVSNLGLNNFEDRVGALKECRRVASQKATLALTTNLQGHMAEFYSAFGQALTDIGDVPGLERLHAHIAHRATVDSVTRLLEDTGFAVSRVIEQKGSMRFANGSALLNHHFIKLGFLDAWKGVPTDPRSTFARLLSWLDTAGELRLTIPMAYIEATRSS